MSNGTKMTVNADDDKFMTYSDNDDDETTRNRDDYEGDDKL